MKVDLLLTVREREYTSGCAFDCEKKGIINIHVCGFTLDC